MRVEIQYALAFTLAVIIIVAGFWPTFYADPAQNEPVRTVHGILASVWLIILVTQPWLIASGRPDLHRWLGRLGIVWFGLLASSIAATIWRGLSEPVGIGDSLPTRQVLGLINLIGLPVMTVLFVLAIRSARTGRIADHRRYLTCLLALILPPGMVRLVTALSGHFRPANIIGVFALVCLVLVILTIQDWRKTRAVFWSYLATVLALLVPILIFPLVMDSQPWLALIRMLGYPA
jgi:hypothetical protein